MTIQIVIVGLRQVGASFGLALKENKDLVKRIGNDREVAIARQAEKLGAVDSISFNLPSAARQADLILLTEPVSELLDTLKAIAPELREGAVVMDTSPVKRQLAEKVARILPPERHYVSLLPTLNPLYLIESSGGPETAHADLFKGGLMIITQPMGTNAEAIRLASDLTNLLGATPLFADAAETDGLGAAALLLPQILAAALLNATTDQPGWREGRKIAGPDFAKATAPILTLYGTDTPGAGWLMNRENALRVIDDMRSSLFELRQAIDDQDQAALQSLLENALANRDIWWKQRQAKDWSNESDAAPKISLAGDMFSRLIGLRRRKETKESK